MDEILKVSIKKAPIPTLAVLVFLTVMMKILETPIENWLILVMVILTFLFSFIIIYFYQTKTKREVKSEVIIDKQEVSDVDTSGGNFIVGVSGEVDIEKVVKVTNNKIEGIKTGGGDFVIGAKGDINNE